MYPHLVANSVSGSQCVRKFADKLRAYMSKLQFKFAASYFGWYYSNSCAVFRCDVSYAVAHCSKAY